jgi:hypothetical protein
MVDCRFGAMHRPVSHPEVPEAVRALLTGSVDSIEKLELIALLHRHPVGWTAITAGEQLRIAPAAASQALEELRLAGVLEVEAGTGYRCRPDEACRTLVELYENDRIAIMTLMAAIALDRIRTSAAHTFADAFRVRGKKKGGPDA